MAQKFVGIDLGDHHIKVAVVSSGLRGVTVLDTFAEPVGTPSPRADGEPPDPLGHRISVTFGALRARGLLGQPVGVCVPSSMASYRILEFPFADQRRIAQTVGFEADGQFPQPIETLNHGHVVVPTSGGGGRALLVASPREKVNQISSVFRRAGSDVKVITSPAIASGQVGVATLGAPTPAMVEQGHAPTSLLIDLGHRFTHFVALGAKGPMAVRAVRRGGKQITQAIASAYNLASGDAEAAKHSDAFLPHRGLNDINPEQLEAGKVVARALEPLLREIEHTRLWLRSTYGLEVVDVALAGGGADLSGLAAYLTEQIGLPAAMFSPKASGLKGVDGKSLALFGSAIGAAYGAARRPLVQLHDTSASDAGGGWVQERMVSLVSIGVAVMAFAALDTIARVRAAETELAAYQEELAEATDKAFGTELEPSEVSEYLQGAEGQDLTSLVPERGALETLAMIVKAATPSDLGSAPPPGAAPPDGLAPPGADPLNPGAIGAPGVDAPAEGEEAAPAKVGPIPADAGIVMVDDLTISLVEIRERKIEIKASANQGSAQDRFASKLTGVGCISNVSKGKVRGDARKSFQMSMDSRCFYKAPAADEEEEEG